MLNKKNTTVFSNTSGYRTMITEYKYTLQSVFIVTGCIGTSAYKRKDTEEQQNCKFLASTKYRRCI